VSGGVAVAVVVGVGLVVAVVCIGDGIPVVDGIVVGGVVTGFEFSGEGF